MKHSQPASAIALFLPALKGGGAQMVFVRLANVWAAQGVQVELVLGTAEGEHLHRVSPEVRVIGLGARRTREAILSLRRYAAHHRPAVVMTALEHANAVGWLAFQGLRGRPALVCSAHQLISPAMAVRGPRSLLGSQLWGAAYRRADGIVAVTAAVAADVAQATGVSRDQIEVIGNPLDVDRVQEMAGRVSAPEMERPHFVAVGRFEPVKDFATLIHAFARVRAARGGRLTLLGEGSMRPMLQELVVQNGLAGSVHMPGFQPNPYPLIAGADALVLSSLREGFGLVLAEAMAVGTQVVATACPGGAAEVIGYGAFGKLARSQDPDGLAGAMIAALDHPVAPEVLRDRARDFDDGEVARRYLAYLRSVVRGARVHERGA